jgi:hypothetical protein
MTRRVVARAVFQAFETSMSLTLLVKNETRVMRIV